MLTQGVLSGNRELIVLACDAAVPPLTFLCFSIGILFSVAFLLATAGGSLVPLGITSVAACAVVLSVVLSARHIRPGAAGFAGFGLVVKYAAMKISIYANALAGRPTQWIRSKRD